MSQWYRNLLQSLLLCLLAVVLLPACCSTNTLKYQALPPSTATSKPELLNPIYRAHRSTISMIHKGVAGCAAVVIRNKKDQQLLVLTAEHCITGLQKYRKDKAAPFWVGSLSGNWKVPTQLIDISSRHDLALLRSTTLMKRDGVFAELATEEPARGSTVYAIGNPNKKEHNISRGVLSNSFVKNNNHVYRTDADLWFGSSGGGLFNAKGQLIGITISVEPAPGRCIVQGGGNATSLPEIRRFLKRVRL